MECSACSHEGHEEGRRTLRRTKDTKNSLPLMTTYQHLSARFENSVEYLTLNRPEVRNAFNEEMIAELAAWAGVVSKDREVRAVVIAGSGPTFSAGADIKWMAKQIAYTQEENVKDAGAAAAMFAAIDALPVPVVGRVHGAALGGGAGLA